VEGLLEGLCNEEKDTRTVLLTQKRYLLGRREKRYLHMLKIDAKCL